LDTFQLSCILRPYCIALPNTGDEAPQSDTEQRRSPRNGCDTEKKHTKQTVLRSDSLAQKTAAKNRRNIRMKSQTKQWFFPALSTELKLINYLR